MYKKAPILILLCHLFYSCSHKQLNVKSQDDQFKGVLNELQQYDQSTFNNKLNILKKDIDKLDNWSIRTTFFLSLLCVCVVGLYYDYHPRVPRDLVALYFIYEAYMIISAMKYYTDVKKASKQLDFFIEFQRKIEELDEICSKRYKQKEYKKDSVSYITLRDQKDNCLSRARSHFKQYLQNLQIDNQKQEMKEELYIILTNALTLFNDLENTNTIITAEYQNGLRDKEKMVNYGLKFVESMVYTKQIKKDATKKLTDCLNNTKQKIIKILKNKKEETRFFDTNSTKLQNLISDIQGADIEYRNICQEEEKNWNKKKKQGQLEQEQLDEEQCIQKKIKDLNAEATKKKETGKEMLTIV